MRPASPRAITQRPASGSMYTFNLGNAVHLREIEKINGIPKNNIKKVRWIKPIYRCTPDQRFAHAIFFFTSAKEANRILQDGIYCWISNLS